MCSSSFYSALCSNFFDVNVGMKPLLEEKPTETVRQVEDDDQVFVAFARVFSGVVRRGCTLFVLRPKHDPYKVHDSVSSYYCRSHWSSGSTLACRARGPRIESCCGQKVYVFFAKITAIRSFEHGLHT